MKVALSKNDGASFKKKREEPPLPLVQDEIKEVDKTKLARFKLRTDPAVDTSPTYDFYIIKINGSETLRHAIRFMTDILKIFTGLNITDAAKAILLYKELLESEALNQFNAAVAKALARMHEGAKKVVYNNRIAAGDSAADAQLRADAVAALPATLDTLREGIRAVVAYMAPTKALSRQKRWMRRFCRKPADMSIRSFANHVTRINTEELPLLPPFGAQRDQMLSDDEVIDVILNGIPRSWMKEMDKQGFDPVEKELQEVIDFCERMENAEDFEPAREGGKTKSHDSKPKSKDSHKGKSSGGGKYCLLHGNNGTHNTDDCLVLKKQAKSLKANDGDRKPAFKNKTWKRDADKSTNSSKKELAAFVRKQARKELYAFANKRKASDDDDEKSLNNVEEGEVDFSMFNFKDMDDLKIDSDDEAKDSDSVSV